MSTDNVTPPQPIPQPAPQPAPAPVDKWEKIIKIGMYVTVMMVALKLGATPEQVQQLWGMISGDTTQTSKDDAKDEKPTEAVNPDEVKQWIDISKQILDAFNEFKKQQATPKPAPTPDPKPAPSPDPAPAPTPAPGPSAMKLVLTDSEHHPITSTSVPVGRLIRVMVDGAPGQVGWANGPHGDVEVSDLPMNLGYDFILRDSTAYVDITVFDAALNKVQARVTANQAPQPPPPVPTPTPTPQPDAAAKAATLTIRVVEDSKNRTAAHADIFSKMAAWNKYYDSGNQWRLYDKVDTDPKRASTSSTLVARGVTADAGMVIYDSSGNVLKAMAVPDKFDDVKATINSFLKAPL